MCQKSLSVHEDCGDFSEVLLIKKIVTEYAKSILACIENKLKSIFGEYAKSISPYMENTPINMKMRLSGRISTKTKKQFGLPKSPQ
jgi:hypothetical protein